LTGKVRPVSVDPLLSITFFETPLPDTTVPFFHPFTFLSKTQTCVERIIVRHKVAGAVFFGGTCVFSNSEQSLFWGRDEASGHVEQRWV
jgi:hypothetical protein